jgi:hypothetical protein
MKRLVTAVVMVLLGAFGVVCGVVLPAAAAGRPSAAAPTPLR